MLTAWRGHPHNGTSSCLNDKAASPPHVACPVSARLLHASTRGEQAQLFLLPAAAWPRKATRTLPTYSRHQRAPPAALLAGASTARLRKPPRGTDGAEASQGELVSLLSIFSSDPRSCASSRCPHSPQGDSSTRLLAGNTTDCSDSGSV